MHRPFETCYDSVVNESMNELTVVTYLPMSTSHSLDSSLCKWIIVIVKYIGNVSDFNVFS
jgi:hypothetical protein